VDIYLSVDPRVIDGEPAARAIRALEAMLNGPVSDELRALAIVTIRGRKQAKHADAEDRGR
jgi:hypothetical protein